MKLRTTYTCKYEGKKRKGLMDNGFHLDNWKQNGENLSSTIAEWIAAKIG
ncbi:AAEL002224-PA [Aedes aegypti]|uniref:AAEL002224-PA n=1 Tax=Aedes aegypti TaxID=7159 RepID=Q17J07_AEDAE|nr:AAEL002224-PA [Aedes aegypti]